MKRFFLMVSLVAVSAIGFSQKKTTTSALVTFDATTPKDAFPKAENKAVVASLDTKSGAVAFEATVKNFTFSNASIQDHFNGEKWLNSEKYPKFVFKGSVKSKADYKKDGTYKGTVTGKLTVKEVTKDIEAPVELTVKGGKISATSSFSILLSDYGIKGAPIDGGKVDNETKITVSASF